MRFEAEWLLECLLLRVKSTATYDHLRATKLIPLPHRDTLRRLIGGMSCHFGFNSMAFEAIKTAMEDKADWERIIILMFDEIAIQAGLEYNCESLAFDGFTKQDDDPIINRESIAIAEDEESTTGESKNHPSPILNKNLTAASLADHALVFMVRTISKTKASNWIQPCGVFASHSSTPGENLYRLMLAAIIRCEVFGARVIAVVCDGAQGNKTMWNMCGIGITSSTAATVDSDNGSLLSNTANHASDFASFDSGNASLDSGNASMDDFSVDIDFAKKDIEVCIPNLNSGKAQVDKISNDSDSFEETRDIINNWMPHPMVPDKKIFFLQDPPHIFKCIRNQMYNHKTVQVYISSFLMNYILLTIIVAFAVRGRNNESACVSRGFVQNGLRQAERMPNLSQATDNTCLSQFFSKNACRFSSSSQYNTNNTLRLRKFHLFFFIPIRLPRHQLPTDFVFIGPTRMCPCRPGTFFGTVSLWRDYSGC